MDTKLITFINRWINRYADWDGVYGAQCFDLIQFWSQELQGGWIPGLLAKDIIELAPATYDRFYNTPDAVPMPGDIMVWYGSYNGGVGHTAVYTKGDVWTFQAFSQNDPLSSPCRLRTYNYSHVKGWIRRKAIAPPSPNADEYVKRITEALQSAENAINTGEQVKDPKWKAKNTANKAKLLSLAGRL